MVGAGCAGSVFAARMASRGFRVLLLDRHRDEELGYDWSDLVETEAFELAGVEPPVPPEAHPPIKGVRVISPDTATRLNIDEHPYLVVDRKLLAARLLSLARQSGAEVITQCIVGGVEIERGYVVSVATDRGTFASTLAVDASGLERVLCRDIPRGMGIPRRLRSSDYLSMYRETREVSGETAPDGPAKGYLDYHLGRYGGYSWVHAEDNGVIDVGTAVQDVTGAPDPRDIVLGFIRSNPAVGEKVVHRGGGRLPTRRPLSTMVASGLMIIGDAACQATPILSRGVGGAMVGGALAADAAAFACEAGDAGVEALWSYNHSYMKERGAQMAALDALRLFLQRLPEKEFSWGLAKGVIDEQEITGALLGHFSTPSAQVKVRSLFKGLRDVPLLARFENALRQAQRVLDLYREFPSDYDAPEYADWSQQADYLFEDAEKI